MLMGEPLRGRQPRTKNPELQKTPTSRAARRLPRPERPRPRPRPAARRDLGIDALWAVQRLHHRDRTDVQSGPPVTQVVDDSLEAGREAARRHAWRDAYELLRRADEDGKLTAEDLENLAEAAW